MPLQPAEQSQLTRGYAIAMLSAGFLSMTAIFMRHLSLAYNMPALVMAFWRDVFTALTLLPVLALVKPALLRPGRGNLLYLAGYGLLVAVFNSMWTLSVAINGASVATVLAYSSTGFTAVLAWWLLKERLDWAKILAVVLTLAGCALVSGALDLRAWQTNLLGILAGVLTGLCYAVYTMLGRRAVQRGLNVWTTLTYTFTIASVFLALFNLIPGGPLPGSAAHPSDMFWLGSSLAGWGVLVLLGAGPTVAGFGLYNLSLTYLPSSVANLVATLEPVFTAITAYFLFGERLTPVQLSGSGLILIGVVFLRVYEGWLVGQVQPESL